jgi:hypothetical protein
MAGCWRKFQNEELHNLHFFAKYNQNEQLKADEMGREYTMHRE